MVRDRIQSQCERMLEVIRQSQCLPLMPNDKVASIVTKRAGRMLELMT